MSRKVRKYPEEFKQEAVTLALQKPSISEAAKSLGIPAATLHGWINTLKESKQVSPNNFLSKPVNAAALLEENRRLHKELSILGKMETCSRRLM